MSYFAAVVVGIRLEPHPNADSLSLVHLTDPFETTVVVNTEAWKDKNKAVYCPVDGVLQPENSEYDWIGKGHRIRAVKLRGIFSYGLLIPADESWEIGRDVTKEVGLTKYEEPPSSSPDVDRSPGGGVEYTDIQNIRRYGKLLDLEEEVVIQTKIHGCFYYNSPIRMADYSYKKICHIKEDEYVLGVNEDGKVVPSKVLAVHKNGRNKYWLKIKFDRKGSGSGNSYGCIICTPNHQIFANGNYVEAKYLVVGDKLSVIRSDMDITPIQLQILIGKMLGDGHYYQSVNGASVEFSHKEEHLEYVDWTLRGLSNIGSNVIKDRISGFGTKMKNARTLVFSDIEKHFSDWTDGETKQIPNRIINDFSPISLAFWYMDDGNLEHHERQKDRAKFATCAFNDNSIQVLLDCLSKFNIQASVYKHATQKEQPYISLNHENAEKMFILISPYVPYVMQYKLPERYRGHQGWLPEVKSVYKPHLMELKIKSIEQYERNTNKYDLTTETQNYFAHQALVHNSNARYVKQDEKLYVGSRTRWIKGDSYWDRVARRYNLEKLLPENMLVFGEVFGMTGGFPYDVPKGKEDLAIFDVYDVKRTRYLDWPDLLEWNSHLNLRLAPVLYRGPWRGLDFHKSLVEGKSILGGKNVEEGFVVRPIKERWDDKIGRVILKYHSESFLLKDKK